MTTRDHVGERQPPPVEPTAVAFSNSIRLTVREWIGVGIFSLALLVASPPLWEQVEPFPLQVDYRIPYELSNDYWLYDRYSRLAASRYEVLVIGDSVIWGPYVRRQETLSHYLNEQAEEERFANLGLNGSHPAALTGLLEYHAAGVKAPKKVLLQCNPLWLTSPVQDLQEEAQAPFNHPDLVPQFFPRIPRYKADISHRIGTVIDRQIPFTSWSRHLQEAYFDQVNIPAWTLDHPYDNPLPRLGQGLPPPDTRPREEPVPWFTRGRKPEPVPWVDLERSLQWQSFQRAVTILQERGSDVFVLVGPYNEHMLTQASRQRYKEVKRTIEVWFNEHHVAFLSPLVLPTNEYGDASHPLSAGYLRLAQQLAVHPFFKD
jgi:hypothetical protein